MIQECHFFFVFNVVCAYECMWGVCVCLNSGTHHNVCWCQRDNLKCYSSYSTSFEFLMLFTAEFTQMTDNELPAMFPFLPSISLSEFQDYRCLLLCLFLYGFWNLVPYIYRPSTLPMTCFVSLRYEKIFRGWKKSSNLLVKVESCNSILVSVNQLAFWRRMHGYINAEIY